MQPANEARLMKHDHVVLSSGRTHCKHRGERKRGLHASVFNMPLGILELRRPRVLPHVARAPARLDLRVLDLTVYFFRLYKYFHEGVTGAVDLCAPAATPAAPPPASV